MRRRRPIERCGDRGEVAFYLMQEDGIVMSLVMKGWRILMCSAFQHRYWYR